jgi:NAD(P)-dependent dehydrogenase (short-subunit alcohol dehydrogenase family)
MTLDGKIALVTGAARGIGRATATVLAEDGADVAVIDLAPAVEETCAALRKLGRRSVAAVCDVTDPVEVAKTVGKVRESLGEINVLVNNAGIVGNIAPVATMSAEAWEREIRVNLSGAFTMIQATIGAMVARGWGRIVNVSSIAARGGGFHQSAYAASKAGLIGLTQSVTLEHASRGITCNAILPGLIATENVMAMPAEIRDTFIGFTPARRLGDVREIGYLVAFLASDRAGFVNGAEIPIDGGGGLNVLPLASRRELRRMLGRN